MRYTYQDVDERIIKTRIALSGAIFEIMKKNETVKVTDICKQADITRMTYYHHFGNKNQLLSFAIRNQFENMMPIPLKLKPQNMRQLIAYIIKIYSDFVTQNNDLINISYNKIVNKKYQNSYIKTLINLSKEWIAHEISLLPQKYDLMTTNILCDFITHGILSTLIDRTIKKQSCKFLNIWDSIKILLN